MVHTFKCHHFIKQNVLSLDDAPRVMCCEEGKLFVATEPSQIHVFDLKSDPPTLLACFPTLGEVISIAFSQKDNFIATVERSGGAHGTSVQAYLSWQNANFSRVVNVRVAGYMTSNRSEESCSCETPDDESHVRVIEIPLKGKVTASSLNRSTSEIVLAVGRHVLVYGLSSKVAAGTGKQYREFKCLLDIQFSFAVHYLDHYGDFFLCASQNQCQLVELSVLEGEQDGTAEDGASVEKRPPHASNRDRQNDETRLDDLDLFISWVENPDLLGNQRNYVVNDSNFVEWDFIEEAAVSGVDCQQAPTDIFVSRMHATGSGHVTERSKQVIVTGPDKNKTMPEVTIEYEDRYHLKDTHHDLTESATSYLYCYLPPNSVQKFIHPFLVPVTLHEESSLSETDTVSTADGQLTSLYCIISTARQSRLYRLSTEEGSQLIAIYTYSCDIKQVYVDNGLLYALSSSCLEIYSCQVVADAVQRNQHLRHQHVIPSNYQLQQCMIGSESFIGLDSMVHSPRRLVLLSKQPCPCQRPGMCCWGLYVLQKPTTAELHQDIVELSAGYQFTKLTSHQHLLYLDYLLLLSEMYTNKATDQVQQMFRDASLALGLNFARNVPSSMDQCVAFLQQSMYSPIAIMKRYASIQLKTGLDQLDIPSFGIIKYFDLNLLRYSKNYSQQIPQEDEEMVVSFYKTWSPARLMYLVLTSRLSKTSFAAVADTLLVEKLSDDRLASLYAVTCLFCGINQTSPQTLIRKLPEDHLKKLLHMVPECLYEEESKELSQLGLRLQQYAPGLLSSVLESLTPQKQNS